MLACSTALCDQRLLNERDLDDITEGMDRSILFVRRDIDTRNGYYVDTDGRWCYGSIEEGRNIIKRRYNGKNH